MGRVEGPVLILLYEFLMHLLLNHHTINYEINRVWVIVVTVHRAAIQLDPALANVLISYIIGVGGLFSLLSPSNAKLNLIETNTTPLVQDYLGEAL